jgi:hypothetical protein
VPEDDDPHIRALLRHGLVQTTPEFGLHRVRQAAQRNRKQRFTARLHHVYDRGRLRTSYLALKRDAAAGVDGETWRFYGASTALGVPARL